MNFTKHVVAMVIAYVMLTCTAYAEEAKDIPTMEASADVSVSVVEKDDTLTIDNSDLIVKVVKYINNVETIIYQGPLGEYGESLCDDIDFSDIDFAVIFNWDDPDEDIIYVVPIRGVENETVSLTESKEITVYQSSLMTTATENAEITVSLLYNNSYSETVLLPGEELTAEFEVVNTNSEECIDMSAVIALYDADGRFVDMKMESLSVEAGGVGEFSNRIVAPIESSVSHAKVMIWESVNSMKPYISPIVLTLSGNDFFGDDYSVSQPLIKRNSASGIINTLEDIDVFQFTPASSGLYYFETFSDIDTYASLYSCDDMNNAIATGDNDGINTNFKLSATLEQGTTYYLYVNGRETGNYLLNAGYAIGNVFGTVAPVALIANNTEYNELIDTTVILATYDTNEYVASMHLRNCSDSINEYSSFSITGIHSNDYLVRIKRPGYLTLYKRIQLMDNAIDLGSKVLVAGDVNDDNIISQDDLSLITSVMNSQYGDDNYLVSADLNSDMIINQSDYELANNNMGLNSNCYNENVNVISGNITQIDNSVLISGYAALESQVACVVFLNNINVFEELCEVDSNGYYEFEIELNKGGIYKISVGDENMEFVISETIEY